MTDKQIQAKYQIRCNKCLLHFINDDDLTLMEDQNWFYKWCYKCKTDSHLMDTSKALNQFKPTN
jgi:Zn finger protein HypA/HybF involved in hydrogenase expression